jgi:hypothetical protein
MLNTATREGRCIVQQLRSAPHLSFGGGLDPHTVGFLRLVVVCLVLALALVAVELGAIYFVDALR